MMSSTVVDREGGTVRVLMRGDVWVHYGQIYVESGQGSPGLAEGFAGQENGLCGGAVAGTLFLITGLHTGDVGFTGPWSCMMRPRQWMRPGRK